MIKKIFILSLLSVSLIAMDEKTPLKSVNSVTLINRENMRQFFIVTIDNAHNIHYLKQQIATQCKVSAEKIMIRALPRHTGSVSSQELSDKALVVGLVSQYSNRFLWNLKS